MKLERTALVIDIESTGVDPCKDRIIELAVVSLKPSGERETWKQRFDPGIPIPAEAAAVHEITDADVAGCPPFSDWALRVWNGIRGKDLIGYNLLAYDLVILDEEMRRAGCALSLEGVRVIDCCAIFKKKEPRTLADAVRKYCGREHEGAHGAVADAEATADVLGGQMTAYPDLDQMSIDELATFSRINENGIADLAGKLYTDKNGSLRFAFGKNKDKLVSEFTDYAEWMLRSNFPGSTCEVLRRELNNLAGMRG